MRQRASHEQFQHPTTVSDIQRTILRAHDQKITFRRQTSVWPLSGPNPLFLDQLEDMFRFPAPGQNSIYIHSFNQNWDIN